ncbi:MAG: integral rane sensor signal transduction histidine kinase [Rickettsiaceae bacterium]|jgi:heavy metal sensor kinase|nr:integral rane sensor signal transduction histidine kinase [Rickettsiaceae bacterium]
MNTRSIYFRLISWYTCLLTIICLSFGGYTYYGLSNHLYNSLNNTLLRRSTLIGKAELAFLNKNGKDAIIADIKSIFSTEENNRFMRISNPDGSIFYLSGLPKNQIFNPIVLPKPVHPPSATETVTSYVKITHNNKLVILSSVFTDSNGKKFLIEVGETTEAINETLNALLLGLIIGLPFVIVFTSYGGYFLMRKSLQPVENIRHAAEEISLNNLRNRLPTIKSGDNIEALSKTLNKMISRIESAYQQVSRFSADASHELRTPLTVIRGELESITLDSVLPYEISDRLGIVLEEVSRLSLITEGLLSIDRLDAGEAKIENQIVDIAELARTTIEQMRLLADEKNITINCNADNPTKVEGDLARLKQIIVNLLDNAIKYTPAGGNININVINEENTAKIIVSDNGIGIPKEDMDRIFERFYRIDKARSRDMGGTGLGLSIAKSICIAHNGDISVKSEPDAGSCFIVTLPLLQ